MTNPLTASPTYCPSCKHNVAPEYVATWNGEKTVCPICGSETRLPPRPANRKPTIPKPSAKRPATRKISDDEALAKLADEMTGLVNLWL